VLAFVAVEVCIGILTNIAGVDRVLNDARYQRVSAHFQRSVLSRDSTICTLAALHFSHVMIQGRLLACHPISNSQPNISVFVRRADFMSLAYVRSTRMSDVVTHYYSLTPMSPF